MIRIPLRPVRCVLLTRCSTVAREKRFANKASTPAEEVQRAKSSSKAANEGLSVHEYQGTDTKSPSSRELEVKAMKDEVKVQKKTIAELDEELRLKLESISGEGGSAGVEYEGGKAVGLKRSVRDNMFRVI